MTDGAPHRDGWLGLLLLALFFLLVLNGTASPAVGESPAAAQIGGPTRGSHGGGRAGVPRAHQPDGRRFDGRRFHRGHRDGEVFIYPYFDDPYYDYDPSYPDDSYCDPDSAFYDPQYCYWDDGE